MADIVIRHHLDCPRPWAVVVGSGWKAQRVAFEFRADAVRFCQSNTGQLRRVIKVKFRGLDAELVDWTDQFSADFWGTIGHNNIRCRRVRG